MIIFGIAKTIYRSALNFLYYYLEQYWRCLRSEIVDHYISNEDVPITSNINEHRDPRELLLPRGYLSRCLSQLDP